MLSANKLSLLLCGTDLRPYLDVIISLFIDNFIIIFFRTFMCTGVMVLRLYLFTFLFEVQML